MPRLPRIFAVCLAVMAGAGIAPARAADAVSLTTCAAIRALSRAEAARELPVRVRGVITLAPSISGTNFTVDDGTGIWVRFVDAAILGTTPPGPGDLVEIEGRTDEGHFAPVIVATSVRRIGRAPLPVPQPVRQLDLTSGRLDSQRVSLAGVVRSVVNTEQTARVEVNLLVSTPAGGFTFILYAREPVAAESLVDAEVSVTGVFLAYFNTRRQFLGARVLTNDSADLRILRPPPADAFAVPEVSLSEAVGFSSQGAELHRRRVRGTVTLCKPGAFFYIQEKPHALRINTRQTDALQPGDIVEASGFFHLDHHRTEMSEAVFRRTGRGPAPVPEEIARRNALVQEPRSSDTPPLDYDDYLVALRGRLLSIEQKQGEPPRLNLECDGVLVPAEFTAPPAPGFTDALRPGSELRVSGVCAVSFSESRPVVNWPTPLALRLLLRGEADIQVLSAIPWWTPARLWAAFGLAGGAALLALAWVALLRRQVSQRSAQLAEEMRARRDAAVEFETTLRERNRLAADLHDTTEQSLTGLALQLEATRALHEKSPERSQRHMVLAQQLLDRSREDLRRSIWNLRAVSLEQHTLFEALQEIVADRSAGLAIEITAACEGAPRPLPEVAAGNLLLLAQEAITNALKHAQPRRIELRLAFAAREVTLSIRDDGRGFDPGDVAGPKSGHFGLQGMRERMKRIGGRLVIESARGRGTLVAATVAA